MEAGMVVSVENRKENQTTSASDGEEDGNNAENLLGY